MIFYGSMQWRSPPGMSSPSDIRFQVVVFGFFFLAGLVLVADSSHVALDASIFLEDAAVECNLGE